VDLYKGGFRRNRVKDSTIVNGITNEKKIRRRLAPFPTGNTFNGHREPAFPPNKLAAGTVSSSTVEMNN